MANDDTSTEPQKAKVNINQGKRDSAAQKAADQRRKAGESAKRASVDAEKRAAARRASKKPSGAATANADRQKARDQRAANEKQRAEAAQKQRLTQQLTREGWPWSMIAAAHLEGEFVATLKNGQEIEFVKARPSPQKGWMHLDADDDSSLEVRVADVLYVKGEPHAPEAAKAPAKALAAPSSAPVPVSAPEIKQ